MGGTTGVEHAGGPLLGHADAAKEAAARARAAKAGAKPGTVWELAEMELLAAELDAALPPRASEHNTPPR